VACPHSRRRNAINDTGTHDTSPACHILLSVAVLPDFLDLRYYLQANHHRQAESAENVLTNARHEIQANVNFIDAESYKFVNTLPASSGIPVSTVACTAVSTSVPPQLPSTEVPVTTLSFASSSDSSSVIIPPSLPAETSDAEIQVDTSSVVKE
jgi:hypothetical protein